MSDKHTSHFTTGEFARLCKVNKQTLIYYDKIGLLSPVFKDANGYRYYSINQYEYFSVIELLKDIGMPLKEIQQFLQQKSPERFLSMMKEKKKEIEVKKKQIELLDQIVSTKIDMMEEALHTDFSAITVEQFHETSLYLSRKIENVPDEEFVEAVSDFIDDLYQKDLDTGFPIGGMTKREHVLVQDYTNYSYLYMEQPRPESGHTYFKAMPGNFLVGYHVGNDLTLPRTYDRLFAEMERLGLTLGEYVFEEYVLDAVVADNPEEYVTKIMIQLKD